MVSKNRAIFNVGIEREVKLSLVKGTNGVGLSQNDVPSTAVSETQPEKVAKLRNTVVSALCKLADSETAIGLIDCEDGLGFAIEISEGGVRECAVVVPTNGGEEYVLSAIKQTEHGKETYAVKSGQDNGVLPLTAVLALENLLKENDELLENTQKAIQIIKKGLCESEKTNFAAAAAIVSENLYRRMCSVPSKIKVTVFNDAGNIKKISDILIENRFFVSSVIQGEFKILYQASAVENIKMLDEQQISVKEWSEEEKRLIPNIPPWYVVPDEVPEICKLIKATSSTVRPKRNFMFRGPSSTGKTSMARAIAATLKMPYVYITCSADTESYSFLGQPMYDENGDVKYVESDFIKAIKHGWVVEVQEPYVIAKQGVLTALNGLLDDGAGITLATGEYVKRHPEAIVIFTTNVSYVGCKRPNQSVLRRMNNVYDVLMPSHEEIMRRVRAVTNFENVDILSRMTSCVEKINAYLEKEQMDDGVCGVSELIDWVMTTQCTGNIVKSALSTIISKAVDSPVEQMPIIEIVEGIFNNDAFKVVDKPEDTVFSF